MTRRTARGLGRPRGRSAASGRASRRLSARLKLWIVPAIAGLALGAGLVFFWRARLEDAARIRDAERALTTGERRRAASPISEDARRWLVAHRVEVREVARAFEVSPVALGGIVAAEKTLLTGRADALGDEVFRTVFGSLRKDDLERWARDQEHEYQRRIERGGGRPTLLTPYLWTLGPAQVSFRLAILYEPIVARRLGRPQRNVAEVLDAVTSTRGNLEYAAALLADAQRAYAEVAGVDIAREPGLLATLYQLGSPTARARRLVAETTAQSRGGTPGAAPVARPRMNTYGAFVDRHADEIATLLGLPRTSR